MNYDPKLPSVADMADKARQRIPGFALDYLEGGIGGEYCLQRNRSALDDVLLWPHYLRDVSEVDLRCELFGHHYELGIGASPVGLANMMWPNAEVHIATAAQQANVPYILSTMSTTPLEKIAELAPDVSWFQLYVPKKRDVMKDIIKRVSDAGFKALVVTVDLPIGAKRDKELKNGLILPFRLTPRLIKQAMMRPYWSMLTLKYGIPQFINLTPYDKVKDIEHLGEFLTQFFCSGVSVERIQEIRKLWQGPLIIKGVQRAADIEQCHALGVDGVIISNHAGRQLDAAPSSINALSQVPEDLRNKMTVLLDSGIRNGLDVVRARALGARAAFSGRSFLYAMAAAGHDGGRQVIEIYRDEIKRTLQQLGSVSFEAMDDSWLKQ